MEEKTKFCKNCQKSITEVNFVIHSLHCQRNIQLCNICNEPVAKSAVEEHWEESHTFQNCAHCGAPIEKWRLNIHQEDCLKRPIVCKYCEIQLASEIISNHESTCGSRTEKCEFCFVFVQLKDKDNHQQICKEDKREKLTFCKFCGLEFPNHVYPDHELSCGSRTDKCPLCDKFVMIKDEQQHREICGEEESSVKLEFCKYCQSEVGSKEFQDHELRCSSRGFNCNQCNNLVKIKDKDHHRYICRRDNLELNTGKIGISAHVEAAKEQDSAECPVKCHYCAVPFPLDCLMQHMDTCADLFTECLVCKMHIKMEDIEQHENICKLETNSAQCTTTCSFCSLAVSLDHLAQHMETCMDRIEDCPVCKASIRAKDIEQHKNICKMESRDRLAVCSHCGVKFPNYCLTKHSNSCGERIEMCIKCKLPVMLRDKAKHIEACIVESPNVPRVTKCVEEQQCAICTLLLPVNELELHYNLCSAEYELHNKINSSSKSKDSFQPEAMDCSGSITSTENLKPVEKFTTCAYCHAPVPERLSNNHKKYCREALKNCLLCEEIFHVEDEAIHATQCLGLRNLETTDSSFRDPQYQYSTVKEEEHYRERKQSSITCSHCQGKISSSAYSTHVATCSRSLKRCNFCDKTFPINQEKEHIQECLKHASATGDNYAYGGYSSSQQGRKNKQNFTNNEYGVCQFCNGQLPLAMVRNHMNYCPQALTNCMHCGKKIHVTEVEQHWEKCPKVDYGHQNYTEGGGAKTKKKNKNKKDKEKPGFIKSFYDGCKNFVSGYSMGTEVPRRLYTDVNKGIEYPAEPVEEILMPCEFCKEPIPIENIVQHESGCRPDVVSLPPQQKIPVSENPKECELSNVKKSKGGQVWITRESGYKKEPNSNVFLERKSKTSIKNDIKFEENDCDSQEWKDKTEVSTNYSKESKERIQQRSDLISSGNLSDTRRFNERKLKDDRDTEECGGQTVVTSYPSKEQMQEYHDKEWKRSLVHPPSEQQSVTKQSNERKIGDNHDNKHSDDSQATRCLNEEPTISWYNENSNKWDKLTDRQVKILIAMKSNTEQCENRDIRLKNKYGEKLIVENVEKNVISSEFTDDAKLESYDQSQVNIKSGEFVCSSKLKEQCETYPDINLSSKLEENRLLKEYRSKKFTQGKIEEVHNAGQIVDLRDVEMSQKEFLKNKNFPHGHNKSLESEKNEAVSDSYMKSTNIKIDEAQKHAVFCEKIFHSTKLNNDLSIQSCNSDWDVVTNESSITGSSFQRHLKRNFENFHSTKESETYVNESALQKDFSIIATSEMKGPVKIDRISLRKAGTHLDETLEMPEQNYQTAPYKKENSDAYLTYQNVDSSSRYDSAKEKEHIPNESVYTNINLPSSQNDWKCFNFNQNLPNVGTQDQNIKVAEEDTMDYKLNDLTKRCKKVDNISFNQSKPHVVLNPLMVEDNKDNSLQSYLSFLDTDDNEFTIEDSLDNNLCKDCKNAMCFCELQKNNSNLRRLSLSEELENKEVQDGGATLEKECILPPEANVVDSKKKVQDFLNDNWNKWRAPISDSE